MHHLAFRTSANYLTHGEPPNPTLAISSLGDPSRGALTRGSTDPSATREQCAPPLEVFGPSSNNLIISPVSGSMLAMFGPLWELHR